MRAQAIGERDLALGRAALEALKARASYPFVTSNLVDVNSGAPLFSRFELVDVRRGDAHVKVAIFGLMSERPSAALAPNRLKILPPIEALKTAMADAKARGGEVFIVLSQLLARDEAAIGEALPEVQLFLGGDSMAVVSDAEVAGHALSFSGSQKGKHVGFMRLSLNDPAGAGAPFSDPTRKQGLERKRADAQRRVETYQRLIDEAAPNAAVPPDPKRARVPVEVYQRQLAAARAEQQLATEALAASDGADAAPRNEVRLELVPLSREIVDEPAVKSLVEDFRKKWPDLTPGH